jgi:hypothetical protein
MVPHPCLWETRQILLCKIDQAMRPKPSDPTRLPSGSFDLHYIVIFEYI